MTSQLGIGIKGGTREEAGVTGLGLRGLRGLGIGLGLGGGGAHLSAYVGK